MKASYEIATELETRHFIYDLEGRLIAEIDAATGATRVEYLWLIDEGWAAPTFLLDYTAVIAGTATEPTLYLIVTDHLGVPVALYDEAGLKVWEHKRMPFGAPNGQPTGPLAASLTTALTLPGQYTDPVSLGASVTDNWMRTYNPQLGRYLQPDPIGLAGGLNRYAYVGGDPVQRIDPRGELDLSLGPIGPLFKKTTPLVRAYTAADNLGQAIGGAILLACYYNPEMCRPLHCWLNNSCGENLSNPLQICQSGPEAEDILTDGLNPTDDTARTRNYPKGGGQSEADKDFDRIAGGHTVNPNSDGGRNVTLPDGSNVSVNPGTNKRGPKYKLTHLRVRMAPRSKFAIRNKTSIMREITDETEANLALKLFEDYIDPPEYVRIDILKEKNWIALPIESAAHFDQDYAEKLVTASLEIGETSCYAISVLEQGENIPRIFSIELKVDDILTHDQMYSFVSWALIPKSGAFAFLLSHDDYFVVAGPRSFVSTMAGGDIAKSFKNYKEYAIRMRANLKVPYPEIVGEYYQRILEEQLS